MDTQSPALPGLSASVARRSSEPAPLRSDVAGFIGRTRRGPLGRAVRVEGPTDAERQLGGLDQRYHTPYAIRGYFENGGQIAHVIRIGGKRSKPASAVWQVGQFDPLRGAWANDSPARGGFTATGYRIVATSPGVWANGTDVAIVFSARGVGGWPELDIRLAAPGGPVETFAGVRPWQVVERLQESSIVRFHPLGPPVPVAAVDQGPLSRSWQFRLAGGTDRHPTAQDYLRAIEELMLLPEPAIIAAPDLVRDLSERGARGARGTPPDVNVQVAMTELLVGSARLLDRLVVLDIPARFSAVVEAGAWVSAIGLLDPVIRRAGAVYHPAIRVRDPLGGTARPVRDLPASGHVAGVMSRMDRERGAHHTPANTVLLDAVDLSRGFDEEEQVSLYQAGINLLRCRPGRGVEVWGGRTLDNGGPGQFIAHRRLIHRLVRAIRTVAEPLVFEVNGPELWFTLVRAVTTVLLAAFRAGALKGTRPEEAFRVRCDESTNPPHLRDLGQLVCEIEVAPATPMEFIHLTLVLSQESRLEVIEA